MQNRNNLIKPYNKKKLAELLGISAHVLKRWLDPLREEIGKCNGLYTSKQVEFIVKKLGLPKEYETEINF
jgi:hypothetical protein